MSEGFGALLWEAQTQWACKLNPEVAEELKAAVARSYQPGKNFGKILNAELDRRCIEGNERHAYKSALGHHFGPRGQAKAAERRKALSRPFAPPDAE